MRKDKCFMRFVRQMMDWLNFPAGNLDHLKGAYQEAKLEV